MLQQGDSVGVFQVESRAQMAMLPRLKPQSYYDLVVQVAIVRPGPIQGKMVHPYLKRRQGTEAVTYASEAVKGVLERTSACPSSKSKSLNWLLLPQVSRLARPTNSGERWQLEA